MNLTAYLKAHPSLKRLVHWSLIPSGQARPRRWVSWFVNPFIHRRGRGARVCRSARMDVLPFQPFELGAGSTIEDFSVVNNGMGPVRIGAECRVGIGSVVIGPVDIGDNVIMAQHVALSGLNHGYQDITVPIRLQPVSTRPIVIEEACWLGANAVVTAGVRVGRHSVVAAGAVVTKDVPPYSVVGGNPARILKQYDAERGEWVRPGALEREKLNA
jgi:acetyltransferase-like isoleucine patch superfamily enzyme